MNTLKLTLEQNSLTRIKAMDKPKTSAIVCEVVGYDINIGAFTGKAPDGSLRYFRFIGNASLPIGSQVSVILPVNGLVGWADTKSR